MSDRLAPRPEPAASGTLGRTPLVHLLLYALDKSLSGTIELSSPSGQSAAILFEAGRPAKVRSAAQPCDDSAVAVGPSVPATHALGDIAALPPETTYAYYEAFDGVEGVADADAPFDPLPLLWTLLRERPPRGHVDAAVARVSSSPLRLTRVTELRRLDLDAEHASAAELLRVRPMTPGELAVVSGLGASETNLLVYLLLVTKHVDVLRAGSSAAPPNPEVPSPSAPATTLGATSSPLPRTLQGAAPAGSISSLPQRPVPLRPSPRPPDAAIGRSISPAPAPSAIPPAAVGVAPAPSPEFAARKKVIEERAATIDRTDYFSMLDVARDATSDEVEQAFLDLAKQWHPDRLPPELGAVRDACSRVFGRMSEARSTLTDEEQRGRYMRLLADGSGSPETQETVAKVVEAATNFQKAEVCFRRNDLAQAELFCRKAVQADPTQSDYHALLAWLIALKPENQSPDKTREALHILDRAIAMSAKCEKAHFYRAMLYKRVGKTEAAFRDFKRVIELNPRNIDAAREVRLYRMRGGARSSKPPPPTGGRPNSSQAPKPEDKGGGLFGRLFKKT